MPLADESTDLNYKVVINMEGTSIPLYLIYLYLGETAAYNLGGTFLAANARQSIEEIGFVIMVFSCFNDSP